jgi:hypothetical protein
MGFSMKNGTDTKVSPEIRGAVSKFRLGWSTL